MQLKSTITALKQSGKAFLLGGVFSIAAVSFTVGQEAGAIRNGWIKSHAISTLGTVKYGADFTHLEYVNPDAPKGGEISIWALGSFDSMHPYSIKGRAGALSSVFFESLLGSTADEIGSYYGLLAETLEYPPDRSAVIFNIRKQARFSDGSPVLANDVVFSFNILMEKGLPSYSATIKPLVKSVKILSPHRIEFTFKEDIPTRSLPKDIGSIPIFSEASYKARGIDFDRSTLEPLVGSGPYVLSELAVGKNITYARNKDYWGWDMPLNRGHYNFDHIRVEYFADSLAAFEGFKSGAYMFRQENSSKTWATGYNFPAIEKGWVKREKIPHQIKAPNQSFVFNLRRDKFKDRRVREAIGLAFNFQWSNETLFYGLYERSGSFWANSDLQALGLPSKAERALLDPIADILPPRVLDHPPFSYPNGSARQSDRKSLLKAGLLLDQAGWLVGATGLRENSAGQTLQVEILESSKSFDRVIAPYIENLKRLGVDAVYSNVDQAEKVTRTEPPSYDFDIIVNFIATPYLANSNSLKQYFSSELADISTFNKAGLKSPAIDYLIERALEVETREESKLVISVLDRVLRAEKFIVPQWYSSNYNIAYYDIYENPGKPPPYSLGYLDFWWYNAEKGARLKAAGAF